MTDFNTGDILLHKGQGLFSKLIMLSPGADYSHVSMYVDHPLYGPCVFESTSLGTLPDVITGEKICGVQLVPFEDRVKSYEGEVFHRPIIGDRTPKMLKAFYEFIEEYHGRPYEEDNLQLIRAELDLFPWQQNKPDDSTVFCSETLFLCQRRAGFMVDDGTPPNEKTPTDCAEGGNIMLLPWLTFNPTYRLYL